MSSANGCPNNNCVAHKKKTLFKTSMNFCPECGTKLAAVCKSKGCYTFLDDPSKKRCARCEAKRADRTDKIKKKGGMAVGALVAAAGTVVEIASLIKKSHSGGTSLGGGSNDSPNDTAVQQTLTTGRSSLWTLG